MNQQNRSNESDEFQDEWLSAYLDDELSAPQRLIVEKRTATDASTQELLVDLQQIRQLIQELPPWTGQSTFDIAKFTSSKVSPSVLPTRDAVTRATDDNHRPTPSNMDSRQDESNSSLELPEVTAENSSIPFPAKELPRHLNEGLLPIDVEHIDHAENRETESTEDEEQYEAESLDAAQRDDQQLDGEQANAEGPAEVQSD